MKCVKKIPDVNRELSDKLISDGWKKLKEPFNLGRAILLSIPFILLFSIIPFILKVFGMLNGFVVFLGLLNAMGSCMDFLNTVIIFIQVPKGTRIVSNGVEIYFKV